MAVVLSAQFRDESYEPGLIAFGGNGCDTYYGDVEYAIGEYLIMEYPDDWSDEELYNFEWDQVKNETDKFRKFNYDALAR